MTDTPLDTREERERLALWCEEMAAWKEGLPSYYCGTVERLGCPVVTPNALAIAALLRSEIPSVGVRPSDLDVAREIFRYERPDEPVREGTVAMLRVTVAHVRAAEARLQAQEKKP